MLSSIFELVLCSEDFHASCFAGPKPSKGYLMVSTNGGLNQMRAGVRLPLDSSHLVHLVVVCGFFDKVP
jgi:hypothetical protein